ncbi:alpha/beta hydrolase family esterase [Agrobacterium vitis]
MTFDELTGLRRPGFFARTSAQTLLCLFTLGVSMMVPGGLAYAAGGCGVTVRAGLQDLTFTSGGIERTAVAYIPQGYTGKAKVPVVFDLHGSNSFPRDQLGRSQWSDVAQENGFIVIAPQGGLNGKAEGTHAWNVPGVVPVPGVTVPNATVSSGTVTNASLASSAAPNTGASPSTAVSPSASISNVTEAKGPDDAAYLSDTVALVKAKFCVDPDRIYASGYSGGGRMLSQYICNGNTDFSAAGFVMSLRAGTPRQGVGPDQGKWLPDPQSCRPGRPVSIIAFWGLKDNTNPYAGGGRPYWQYGGEAALNRWAELDGCQGERKIVKGTKISSAEFERCKGGARILSYTIADQTHDWPAQTIGFSLAAANSKAKAVDGKSQEDMYAAKRMWAFFDSGDGRLIADNIAKNACADGAKPAAGATASANPACSVTMKAKVKPQAVESPMSADAL